MTIEEQKRDRAAADRRYYLTHFERDKERRRAYNRRYYKSHREERLAVSRRYAESHPEKINAATRRYEASHRVESKLRKRARARGLLRPLFGGVNVQPQL